MVLKIAPSAHGPPNSVVDLDEAWTKHRQMNPVSSALPILNKRLRRTTQVFPALHCYTGRLVSVGAVPCTGDPQTLPDQIALFPQLFSLGAAG